MSDIAIIGDLDTVTGFKLGGVKEGKVVKTNEEAENAFDALLDEKVSIILITEKIAKDIRQHINKQMGNDVLPMVIEIPDKSGSEETENEQMADLIKRVIGVEMVK
jgi:V/A-type H+-transporting ATPase subunit F